MQAARHCRRDLVHRCIGSRNLQFHRASRHARIRLAQTSNVTNCMMLCNSQAANCQTTCVIPGSQPTGAATTGSNANANTSCQLNCTTQQISCQTTCARTSPSQ